MAPAPHPPVDGAAYSEDESMMGRWGAGMMRCRDGTHVPFPLLILQKRPYLTHLGVPKTLLRWF